MNSKPKTGTEGHQSFVVQQQHAITFSGDGMPAVLSTPQLIALIEQTARESVASCLEPDQRTVGAEIDLRHLAPTPLGQQVNITTRVVHSEGASITFQVEARDTNELIARGTHKRSVISLVGFSRRVDRKRI